MSESTEYAELENGNIKDNGTKITVTQDNGETTVKMTEGNVVQGQPTLKDTITAIINDNEADITDQVNTDRVAYVREKYRNQNQNDNTSDADLDNIIRAALADKSIAIQGGKAKRSKKSAKKGKKSRGMKGKRGRRSAKKGRK